MTRLERRYEQMVNALSSDVFRYAYALCRDRGQAEDLTQETFLRAWRFLDALRDDRKAKSWLFTTVRREFARQFERYQPALEELDNERLADEASPDPDVWTMRRAIAELPLKYREIIMLQIVGGYSATELAEMLEMPRATVNTRLYRARVQLRRAMEAGPRGVLDGSRRR